MAKKSRFLLLAALALSAAGCLQVESSHTLYLSPEGAVSWMAEERGVYSDETDLVKRQAEEAGYIVAAQGGAHKMALGLTALGPDGLVKTHVLRSERPFHVVTEARFGDIDRVMQRLFDESGLATRVTIDRIGNETTLRVVFDFSQHLEERENPVSALLEGFDSYHFVLTDGEWTSASGFDLNGNVATLAKAWLDSAEKASETDGTAELVLTWKR